MRLIGLDCELDTDSGLYKIGQIAPLIVGGGAAIRRGIQALRAGRVAAPLATAARFGDELPTQMHHFATNKSSAYTPRMQAIADRYGLSLDDTWNTELMPHLGRHPNAYHEFVLDGMEAAARQAGSNQTKFLELFEEYVRAPIRQNPELLRSSGWG